MRRAIVLVAAAAIAATACGDDDDAGRAPDADGAVTAATSATAGGDDFCDAVGDYVTLTDENPVLTAQAEPDPAEVEALFAELRPQLDELEAAAPEELTTDVELFASGTRRFIEAVEAAGYDFDALAEDEELAELTTEFESPAYAQAAQRLQAYAVDTCGIGGA